MNIKTKFERIAPEDRLWYLVDATNLPVGRLASEVAKIIRGKHKPYFAPHLDVGDHVIVVNASKVEMTGNKPDETDSRLDLIVTRLNVMAEEMEWMKEKLIRFQNALDILTGRFE